MTTETSADCAITTHRMNISEYIGRTIVGWDTYYCVLFSRKVRG